MATKKIEVIELALISSERYFELWDTTLLNFNKVVMIDRPVKITSPDGRESWIIRAKPISEDNTAEFISNHATEFNNGYKEKTGESNPT